MTLYCITCCKNSIEWGKTFTFDKDKEADTMYKGSVYCLEHIKWVLDFEEEELSRSLL